MLTRPSARDAERELADDDDANRLTEVPGIGPIRASRIAATGAERRHIREVMAALQGYGISTSLAVRIYKKFGDKSGGVITEEPYRFRRSSFARAASRAAVSQLIISARQVT